VSAFSASYSRPTLALYGLGTSVLVAVGAVLATRGSASIATRSFGILCSVFFGFCAIVIARRLFDSRPVLLINEAGIFDRRATDRMVPWSAIAKIGEMRVRNQQFYLFELSQPARQFIDDRYKRSLSTLNRPWVRNGVFVGANGLTASHEQIGSALRKYSTASLAIGGP